MAYDHDQRSQTTAPTYLTRPRRQDHDGKTNKCEGVLRVGDLDSVVRWADNFPTAKSLPVDRLAAALFVNCSEPGTRLIATFTAYCDASGDGNTQPRVIVSGYVANYLQWKCFEQKWQRVHDIFKVNIPFHMAEFVAATNNPKYQLQTNARADYVKIARDQNKANDFLKELSVIQLSVVHYGISCIVPMSLYEEVNSLLSLREAVPPYALAARMCIQKLHQWERQCAIAQPAEYIFEEGDFEQGKVTDLMVDEGEALPIYKKKADCAGLQGADHYAWEQSHFLRAHDKSGQTAMRLPFKWLLQAIPKLHTEPTLSTLIDLCHTKGIDPRLGVKR